MVPPPGKGGNDDFKASPVNKNKSPTGSHAPGTGPIPDDINLEVIFTVETYCSTEKDFCNVE